MEVTQYTSGQYVACNFESHCMISYNIRVNYEKIINVLF